MTTNREVFIWGAVGACVPIFYKFALIDPKTALSEIPQSAALMAVFISLYLLKIIAQIIIGGIIALWRAAPNPDKATLIFLGMSAPAMIGMVLAGKQVENNQTARIDFSLTPSVYAAEQERFKVKDFAKDAPGILDTAKQALLDSPPEKTHYIIIAERDELAGAKEFAIQMWKDLVEKGLLDRKEGPPLTVQVYLPYKGLKHSVVLAEQLSHDEADHLAKLLLKNDFKVPEIYDLNCACFPDRKGKE